MKNIIPGEYPEAMLEEIKKRIVGAQAIFVVIVKEEGMLWYDSCGHEKRDVLWALECAKIKLMAEEIST